MATPMTSDQIETQLKKWGIPYRIYKSDWKTHNRNSKGAWGPVNGFMWHHVGDDNKEQKPYLYSGDSQLPGPLCQFHIDYAGVLWIIGWGRANHAGGGDPNVLQHVIAEDYTGVLTPHEHQGSAGAVDGNARFYGCEIGYSGNHGMTPAQYSTALKLSAAILDFHGWTGKSVIGHGEWSDWKTDPGYAKGKLMDMNAVRGDVQDVLNRKDLNADGDTTDAGEPNAPKPNPTPTPSVLNAKKGDLIQIGSVKLRVEGV